MVKFYLVTNNEQIQPATWRSRPNVSCMDYRTWISYCDV